jgi:DNA-binding IclR family transcriptional regulator
VPGLVQSVERAAAVLRLLASAPGPLALADVANALGLAKGTAHGLLRTLEHVGFVEQDRHTGRWVLGPWLAAAVPAQLDPNELRSRAMNWADTLAARSGQTVRVGALSGSQVRVVHHVFRPDDTEQELTVGQLLPAHVTALGKVLLAFHPSVLSQISTLERRGPRSITDRRTLQVELSSVRARGWAVDHEELVAGEAGIAAPIRGHGGFVVGAIGIRGEVDRVVGRRGPLPDVVEEVVHVADAISRDLVGSRG